MITDRAIFMTLLQREFRLSQQVAIIPAIIFFLLAASLFAFALNSQIGNALPIVWILFMLAFMLGNANMFDKDIDNDILAQLWLGNIPLLYITLSKIIAVWVARVGALIVTIPVVGIWLNVDAQFYLPTMLACAIAGIGFSAAIVAINAIMARIAANNIFLMLLVIPLLIPLLIFGILASQLGYDTSAQQAFYLLGATSLMLAVISIPATMAALRSNM